MGGMYGMRQAGLKKRRRRSSIGRERSEQEVLRIRAVVMLSVCALACSLGMAALVWPRADVGLLSIGMPVLAALSEVTEQDAAAQQAAALYSQEKLDILVKPVAAPAGKQVGTGKEEPRVLIYHTHATEAYLQTGTYTYTPSGSWRTKDNEKNVIAVGRRLAEILQDTYHIPVIHDTTNHEPPKLSTSYSRSEKTMRAYREKYPSIQLFIDVHRDAYGTAVAEVTDYIEINGKQVARLMFVVGTGKGATGTGFDELPDFESNYALARQITEYLCKVDARLARDVRVKTGRYNQHISDHCLLVEVGHNANSLEQALAAMPYLAGGIAEALESLTLNAGASAASDPAVWSPQAG